MTRALSPEPQMSSPIVEWSARPPVLPERSRTLPEVRAAAAVYRTIKTYDHNEGLSCCFRQWRANHSHCKLIHGYALAFRFVFATTELDKHNWGVDFGGLQPLKAWLKSMFDHTMLVAVDDPHRALFEQLASDGLVNLRTMPAVGCEATAKYVFDHVSEFVAEQTHGRVWLESVEVREHGGNSATYTPALTAPEPERVDQRCGERLTAHAGVPG
jgi:6-pyruvoyltetrahydropterin/6-carboxytetrahydropterin synthase